MNELTRARVAIADAIRPVVFDLAGGPSLGSALQVEDWTDLLSERAAQAAWPIAYVTGWSEGEMAGAELGRASLEAEVERLRGLADDLRGRCLAGEVRASLAEAEVRELRRRLRARAQESVLPDRR